MNINEHLLGCGVYSGHRCSCLAKRIKIQKKKSQKKKSQKTGDSANEE